MTQAPRSTVPALLEALLAADGARPLVTHLGAGGMRTELSVRTFENNAAKAANLLRDDADLQPGDVVHLSLPLHWQTSVWLGACALVGAVASVGGPAGPGAEVAVLGPEAAGPTSAALTLATALHPLGMPFASPLPPGVLDAAVEVRAHGDVFRPARPAQPEDAWLAVDGEELTQAGALDAAATLGEEVGLARGGRLLVAAPLGARTALALLALPLALDAAVVLLAADGPDVEAAVSAERCDAVLRG